MKYDAAFEALKRANPEPDPAALRRDLSPRATTDLIDVARRKRPTTPTKPRPRQLWRPALAGGLMVLMFALAMLVPWTGNRSVLDRIRSSPADIATRYLEARNAFDADAARDLLADNALLRDVPRMERGELDLGFEALRVYGMQLDPFQCKNAQGATFVNCDYLMDTRLSQIRGFPQVAGRIQFLIEEGQITRLVHDFNFNDYAPNVHEPYIDWLNQNHPGVVEQLFVVKDGVQSQILTPESLALAADYLDEYDRFLNR
ncbi:MAG TPA: hypothetical protein VJ796_02060 [Acidimicrobiia bacterium]|nr:hypothetical protein [Acidimicrobiia bacterium]